MSDEFKVHHLNERGMQKAQAIASEFAKLLEEICILVPPGRERSLVITGLQESCFWTKRGIALQIENQEGLAPQKPERPFGCSSDCTAPGCGGGCSQ